MTCNEFREQLMDLVTTPEAPSAARSHAETCGDCAAELASMRQTMAMLDEWTAPADTSPYFMTRLRARMRAEEAPARGWLSWLRNPALAVAMMLLMVLSISLYRGGISQTRDASPIPGTAVSDLQNLDKNHDMLADFELLDDLEQQPAQSR